MQTSIFNTIGLQGEALIVANTKASNQSSLILQFFKEYKSIRFTPFHVQSHIKRIYGKDYPITSVRARMNTLTEQGYLIKSEKAEAKGIYKVPNHLWQLNASKV